MKKSQKIREFLKDNAADSASIAEGTGLAIAFVQTVCAQRVKAGEFRKSADGLYSINPGYTRGATKPAKKKRKAGKPARRAKRKAAGKSRAARLRSYRDIKVPPAQNGNGLRQALIDNYLEASSNLRAGLIEEVRGWEENPLLKHLVATHKAAEHLLDLTHA